MAGSASDGVQASLHAADGPVGPALRLDFDLGGTAGYAAARRALPLELPPNYELTFCLRADAPVNEFQVKFVDASGDNVWWFRQPDFEFPRQWRLIQESRKRQIEFAWGPCRRDAATCRSDRIRRRVPAAMAAADRCISASSALARAAAGYGRRVPAPFGSGFVVLAGRRTGARVDGDAATAWESDPAAGKAQSADAGSWRAARIRRLSCCAGRPANSPRATTCCFRAMASAGDTCAASTDGRGGPDALRFPRRRAALCAFAVARRPGGALRRRGGGNQGSRLRCDDERVRRGAGARCADAVAYPRGFSGEQSYWTLVGIDGGSETGLLSEDGALEVARGGFSIEPLSSTGARVMTWADVRRRPSWSKATCRFPASRGRPALGTARHRLRRGRPATIASGRTL